MDPAPASEESPGPFGRHVNIRYAAALRDMARLNQPNVIGLWQAKPTGVAAGAATNTIVSWQFALLQLVFSTKVDLFVLSNREALLPGMIL